MRINVIANGKKAYVEDRGIGNSWWAIGDEFKWSGYYTPLGAIAKVLKEFGEEEISNYLDEKSKETCFRFFYAHSYYKEKEWTISDAEAEFDKWCKEHTSISLRLFHDYGDEDDWYDEEVSDHQRLLMKIDELIGWRSKWDGMDRQHMRVGLRCRWGAIDPAWTMEFRNPTYITYKDFNLDKMREELEEQKAKEHEYYEKLQALQEEYGIYS